MRPDASARAGALILVCLAACSSHVDVGVSRDAAPPPKADAAEGGGRSDAGVTRADPSTEELLWVRDRRHRH